MKRNWNALEGRRELGRILSKEIGRDWVEIEKELRTST